MSQTQLSRTPGTRTGPVKLDANENPWPPPPGVRRSIARAMAGATLHRYPSERATELRAALASYTGVPADRIVVGNGSDELISLALWALGPARRLGRAAEAVVVSPPTFQAYETVAEQLGLPVVRVPLGKDLLPDWPALAEAWAPSEAGSYRVMVLCRPNNPTGTVAPLEALEAFARRRPAGAPLLVDEAYAEFLPDNVLGLLSAGAGGPTGVFRTLSKAFGLAGLRVGYFLGTPDLVAALEAVRMPYNVSAPAQAAATVAVRAALDTGYVARNAAALGRERQRLARALRQLGLTAVPSAANFLLLDLGPAAGDVWRGLAERGVLVRRFSVAGLSSFLRVTVGLPAENRAFVQALAATLSGPGHGRAGAGLAGTARAAGEGE